MDDKIKVVGNNLLVEVLPPPKASRGGILLIPDVAAGALGIGKVIAVGHLTGNKLVDLVSIPGLKKGDYVAFIRMHEKMDSNKHVQKVIGDGVIRLRPADVLLVLDESDLKRLQ